LSPPADRVQTVQARGRLARPPRAPTSRARALRLTGCRATSRARALSCEQRLTGCRAAAARRALLAPRRARPRVVPRRCRARSPAAHRPPPAQGPPARPPCGARGVLRRAASAPQPLHEALRMPCGFVRRCSRSRGASATRAPSARPLRPARSRRPRSAGASSLRLPLPAAPERSSGPAPAPARN